MLTDEEWQELIDAGLRMSITKDGDEDEDWWFDPDTIGRGRDVIWYASPDALALVRSKPESAAWLRYHRISQGQSTGDENGGGN